MTGPTNRELAALLRWADQLRDPWRAAHCPDAADLIQRAVAELRRHRAKPAWWDSPAGPTSPPTESEHGTDPERDRAA